MRSDRESVAENDQCIDLAIRARISAVDAGGVRGRDDLDVEVVLHQGVPDRELHLGSLDGPVGGCDEEWQDLRLDVTVLAAKAREERIKE